MSDEPSFGVWLRRQRKSHDWTQAELAQRVGCALGTVRKLETDEARPSKQLAERMAHILGIAGEDVAPLVAFARGSADAPPAIRPPLAPAAPPPAATPALPTGTVTFVFAALDDSARLWERHPALMPGAIEQYRKSVRAAIAAQNGSAFQTTADGFAAAFARAPDALAAALGAQRALRAQEWGAIGAPLVQMAVHTGTADVRGDGYVGPPLSKAARLLAAAHGGQILVSRAVWELAHDQMPPGTELLGVGAYKLSNLSDPEHVFQLAAADLPSAFPPLRGLASQQANLPLQLTPLIGREREVAAVCALIRQPDARLLTLTGPGGTGKTRLAVQVASELVDMFPDGVCFVDLAPLTEPARVVATIAQSLAIRDSAERSSVERLATVLRERRMLLLLDNFEQVVDAAPDVGALLASCPLLTVLVTSRIVLHLSGEREWPVPPLTMPTLGRAVSRDQLSQYEAVRLFIARAEAVKPTFVVTNASAPAVAEICVQLDGLPLAIELAAARVKLFSPEALLARLDGRLDLLTSGGRDRPSRQQTIRNTIDWSYRLLDAPQQALFARLGVFVGGWTLELAEAVVLANGAAALAVAEGIAGLIDNSLVQERDQQGAPRFFMLETIREYALEQLAQRGEVVALRQRHLETYLALAEAGGERFWSGAQMAAIAQFEAEFANLSAALQWAEATGQTETLLRIATALSWFWVVRGYPKERRWLERGLAAVAAGAAVAAVTRAHATCMLGFVFSAYGDYAAALRHLETSSVELRALGDERGLVIALNELGDALLLQGAFARAEAVLTEAMELAQALDNPLRSAQARGYLGCSLSLQGDAERALPLLEASIAVYTQYGERQVLGYLLTMRALCWVRSGDLVRARRLLVDALTFLWESGNRWGIGYALNIVALTALIQRQMKVGGVLLGAAEAFLETVEMAMVPSARAEYDPAVAGLRAGLGEEQFQQIWAVGRALSLERTVEVALAYAIGGDANVGVELGEC